MKQMGTLAPIPYNYDMSAVDPFVGGGDPLPSGTYAAKITGMEVKQNRNTASGYNLALEYTVIEGEFKGRKFFGNLNLWFKNPSNAEKEAQTIEIANRQLSSIAHAVNQITGSDLTQLAEKPMSVGLEYQDATPDKQDPNTGETIKGRRASNNVLRHDPYLPQAQNSGQAPIIAQQQQAAQAQAAPAFNPAAQAPAQAAPAAQAPAQAAPAFNPAAQQAPAFNPAAQQQAAPAAVNGAAPAGATPPWQK
jgi:hypothetical protein